VQDEFTHWHCSFAVSVGRFFAGDETVRPAVSGNGSAAFAKYQQLIMYAEDGRHFYLDSSQ